MCVTACGKNDLQTIRIFFVLCIHGKILFIFVKCEKYVPDGSIQEFFTPNILCKKEAWGRPAGAKQGSSSEDIIWP